MNIFVLADNQMEASKHHCDRHVVSQIKESAQMLSSVFWKQSKEYGEELYGLGLIYRLSHQNHPCTLWANESISNWVWLRELVEHLHDEWRYRFEHSCEEEHKSYTLVRKMPLPGFLPNLGLTDFAQAMPDEYKVRGDAVSAYRAYYRGAKKHLLKFKKREDPWWL